MKYPNWLSSIIFRIGLGGFAVEMKNRDVLEIRDIGHGDILTVRLDIEKWLNNQCPKRWKICHDTGILPEGFFHIKRSSCVFMFQNEEDRTLFKIVWAANKSLEPIS